MSTSKDQTLATGQTTPPNTSATAPGAHGAQHKPAPPCVAVQATLCPVKSDEAQQAWRQTRLRYPALGLCRR